MRKENLKKYVQMRIERLIHSSFTFSNIFEIMFDQGDRILAEYLELTGLKQFSYKEGKEYCHQMATFLLPKLTAPKGSFVGLYMENCINWIAAFWAILMCGYKPMLLNCKLPNDLVNHMIQTLGIQDIVTNADAKSDGLNGNKIILSKGQYDPEIRKLEQYQPIAWGNEIALSSTATSGNYKIAIYNGKDMTNLIINLKSIIEVNFKIASQYKRRLKQLALLPFYHVFGLVGVYLWFTTMGRTIVFLKDNSSSTIQHTIKLAEVTHIFGVPMFWNQMAKAINRELDKLPPKKKAFVFRMINKSIALQNVFPHLGPKIARKTFKEVIDKTFGPSLQYLISGGSHVNQDALKLINGLGYYLTTGYGSTEASIVCVEVRLRPKYRLSTSVGKCFPTVVVREVNRELQLQGWSTCSTIITKDGKKYDIHDKWYDTRDRGYYDKKGYLYIEGRTDDVIIGSNGEKINPDLIEEKINLYYVKNFVVMDVNGKTTLIIQTPINPTFHLIQRIVKDVQEQYNKLTALGYKIDAVRYTTQSLTAPNAIKVARRYVTMKLAEGKIELLPFSELAKYQESSVETINEDLIKKVTNVFANVLNKDASLIQPESNFFLDLGGTSLDYFTLLKEMQDQLDITIEMDKGLQTVNDFCHYIKKGDN